MAENTVKIMEKLSAYKGAQEPPLVFGQALVKILKASSAQFSQPWATFKCILRWLSSAVLGEAEQRFFSWLFSSCSFVGDESSCSSSVRSTQSCYPLYKGGGRKAGSSHLLPSPLETSKPVNLPQNIPCFTHRGYRCPQAEQQPTGSFCEPSPSRQEGSSN